MTSHRLIRTALAVGFLFAITPAFAAEGADAGNGTSTPAGPAGDNAGPTKAHSMSSSHTHTKKMKHHSHSM